MPKALMSEAQTVEEHKQVFQTITETLITDQPLDDCVRRGANYLDRQHPGWADKINLKTFDINSCGNCVVGQVFGHYTTHAEKAFNISSAWGEEAYDYGINYPHNSKKRRDTLQRDWTKAIKERQTQ